MYSTFQFVAALPHLDPQHCRRVKVPCHEPEVNRFIRRLGKVLHCPEYFGDNWNALEECLRDLSWFKERDIVLWHPSLPEIPEDQLRIYLAILQDAAQDWKTDDAHRLIPLFDAGSQDAVELLMKA